MPGQESDGMSKVGADVPTNIHEALYQLSKIRDAQTPRDENISQASIIRRYIREGLQREEELPEEVRDLLDEDLLANAGEP